MAFIGTPLDTRNTFQSLQGKRFNGDGSETEFTLDVVPSSVLDIEVFVGNVRQDPNSAYTLSGTTLTFTGAPPSGTNNIYVVHQAKSVGTIDVPSGGVQSGSLASAFLTGQTDIGAGIADADLFLLDDGAGGTLRKTAASRIKTYAGFTATTITGTTALTTQPAATDEIILSDAGTLKRLDFNHIYGTPSFRARMSSDQTLGNGAHTKLAMDAEDYDTDGKYDKDTNYRFTPTVAGEYWVWGKFRLDTGTSMAAGAIEIYKNGSNISKEVKAQTDSTTHQIGQTVTLDADDYVEIYGYQNSGGNVTANGGNAETQDTGIWGAYRIVGT